MRLSITGYWSGRLLTVLIGLVFGSTAFSGTPAAGNHSSGTEEKQLTSALSRPADTGTPSFALIPGALTQIAVGADGSVWGINSSQQIYTWDATSQSWTNIPGSLTKIAVGSSNAVWGLNESGQIYDYVAGVWLTIPGTLSQIAVGVDGDVWGLNSQSSVYHYDATSASFKQVSGALSQIAVGSAGSVYGINSAGSVVWYNPGTGQFEFLPLGALSTIAVGADGTIGGINNGVIYGYTQGDWVTFSAPFAVANAALGTGTSIYALDASGNIYFADVQAGMWVQIPGTLTSIAVGGNGAVWGINGFQQIFQLQNAAMRGYQTLTSVPGTVSQISVGVDGSVWALSGNTVEIFNTLTQTFQPVGGAPPLVQLSAGSSGDVWGVDAAGKIYQFDPSSSTWNNIGGELNFIRVGANHAVWGINAIGQTYAWDSSTGSWLNIPGTLTSLSVGADGTVWGINAQQQIYQYNGSMQAWVNVPGSLVEISVGDANNIWGVNQQNQVYRYDATKPGWDLIPGAVLADISVSFDGTVWGANPQGTLYQWNSSSGAFSFVGNGATKVYVGNAAAVWGLDTNTGAALNWF